MEDAKNIAKTYNPAEFEDRIYNEWVEKGYFHAEVDKDKEPCTIVIPPPNVTGQLHMGHRRHSSASDARTPRLGQIGARPRACLRNGTGC